jgi:hypothetical protein
MHNSRFDHGDISGFRANITHTGSNSSTRMDAQGSAKLERMSMSTRMTNEEVNSNNNAEDNPEVVPGIQVICAGLGRTGTLSLTEALKVLGYKPYHFVDLKHAEQWAALSRGEMDVDQIINLIASGGYTAVLENPTCDIYLDILRQYPEAKVILSVRDTPQKFETSWKTLFDTMVLTEQGFRWTFPSFFGWIPLFRNLKETRYMMGTTHLRLARGELTHGWRSKPEGWLGEQYAKHNQHVKEHVPSDQLLVLNVKEGWKPLCDFLGCEIPDGPFPHSTINDAKALKQLRRHFLIAIYSWIPLLVSVGAGASWYGYGLSKRRRSGESSKPITKL